MTGSTVTGVFEKRRTEKREYCGMKVEYSLEGSDCGAHDCGPWVNITSDISFSGMGLYSEHPIEKGSMVNIFLRHISPAPRKARAVWCLKIDDSLYRVGLKYC